MCVNNNWLMVVTSCYTAHSLAPGVVCAAWGGCGTVWWYLSVTHTQHAAAVEDKCRQALRGPGRVLQGREGGGASGTSRPLPHQVKRHWLTKDDHILGEIRIIWLNIDSEVVLHLFGYYFVLTNDCAHMWKKPIQCYCFYGPFFLDCFT